MCFSATASFSSSACLGIVGALLITKYKNSQKLWLATIPFFFAVQQFVEGLVWLNKPFDVESNQLIIAKNLFVFFAYIFWPIWVPFSLSVAEKINIRKKILTIFCVISCLTAILSFSYVFKSHPEAHRFSIDYQVNIKMFGSFLFYNVLYVATTVVSFFISSIKYMKFFGTLVGLLGLIAYIFDKNIGASLWCFFAALCSLFLIFLIKKD